MLKEKTYNGPRFKLGKVVSKYLIIEILAFAHDDYKEICSYLFYSSRSFRLLLTRNYNELKFMVVETHNVTIEATLPLTYNHETARSALLLLEKIVTIECEKAKVTNYGLAMKPGVELKIANTEETEFLLQAELYSINRGNMYVSEKKGAWGERTYTMRGYFDQKNNLDGPAIVIFDDGESWFEDFTKSNTHFT